MLILALDTTTRAGSCALLHDEMVLREQGSDPDRPPAARLPADLMALVEHAGVSLDDIDVFAVATGPGSFTGLRIGIATMQGLAFAVDKPLVGVSALDALAFLAGVADPARGSSGGMIATWVDAWRGEVYAALYGAGPDRQVPIVSPPGRLLEHYAAGPGAPIAAGAITFLGDGAGTYRSLIVSALGRSAVLFEPAVPLLAGAIGHLASAAARAGELPPPHAIRPLYVRRPDAELARER